MRAAYTQRNQDLSTQRRVFEQQYGDVVQFVDFLDRNPTLRDEFIQKAQAIAQGNAPATQPTTPNAPGAPAQQPPQDPRVGELAQQVNYLMAERQRAEQARLRDESLNDWAQGGELWQNITGTAMTQENKWQVMDRMRANNSADVEGTILAIHREALLQRRADQMARGAQTAQSVANQGAAPSPTATGPPTLDVTKLSYEEALRMGEQAFVGNVDEDYNEFVQHGTE